MARERTPEQLHAVGQRLKAARESLGLSQREICDALGVRPTTWNHWETGRRLPDPMVMVDMAASHPVSLDWIYSGASAEEPFAPDAREAIGQRIQAARMALSLSRSGMAEAMTAPERTVESWEAGRSAPGIGAMIRLASRFGISLDWVFRGDPSNLPHRIAQAVLNRQP